MITNLSLGKMPDQLNLYGSGSVVVTAYFGRDESQTKCYELVVGENGSVTLTPCAVADACATAAEIFIVWDEGSYEGSYIVIEDADELKDFPGRRVAKFEKLKGSEGFIRVKHEIVTTEED